jgi:flagellar basal-body rod protein FlgF
MDRMLYVAMTGAKNIMLAQAINNNNLANINTTGFRADLASFQSVPITGAGYPSRTNAVVKGATIDMTAGPIINTGRALDVAMKGDGLITVQAPDGNEAYTRAGDLKINSAGMLVTGAGFPVMGNSGPIAIPPNEKLEIGSDGTISIQPLGQSPNTLAVVDRIRLVKAPADTAMTKTNEGLLRTNSGDPLAADGTVSLQSGVLETSNVNGINALANMIELSRHYEAQIKLIKAAEDNDAAGAQLLRIA